MTHIILFNKPFGVICQFSASPPHPTLKEFIRVKDVYPAGRLDSDSEGLLILSNDGKLQAQISHPRFKKVKTYIVQVEGKPTKEQLARLAHGVELADFITAPAQVTQIDQPEWLWERDPAVRFRKSIPTSWLEIGISEGKNRQVRRMTAKVGLPTLRLIRSAIGGIKLADLAPGQSREMSYLDFIQQFNHHAHKE